MVVGRGWGFSGEPRYPYRERRLHSRRFVAVRRGNRTLRQYRDAVLRGGSRRRPRASVGPMRRSAGPSRRTWSMFTGLLPSEHGAHFQSMAYRLPCPTVAERFAAAGYHTEIITRNSIFDGSLPGVTRGFTRITRPVSERGARGSGALFWPLEAPVPAADPNLGFLRTATAREPRIRDAVRPRHPSRRSRVAL